MEVYFCLEGRLVTALSAELISAQVSPGRREDEELPPGNPIQINLLTRLLCWLLQERAVCLL